MKDNSLEESLKSLANSVELAHLESKIAPFNVFELLQVGRLELCHSNILAWLLDPRKNHGLEKSFLKRWLYEVFRTTGLDLDAYSFESVQVLREWNNIDL